MRIPASKSVNGSVDSILLTACLDRILAQVEVAFSNSLIEAYWRSLKHQWLFLNTLDSVARVRAMVESHVSEHNTKMPHPAFNGQTPDEMFFGTGAQVPEELALAKGHARAARMAANRTMSCERCLGQQVSLPESKFLIDSRADAVANTKFIMSSHTARLHVARILKPSIPCPLSLRMPGGNGALTGTPGGCGRPCW